jgi:nucleoside-diphosphate-sugar epimerase
MTASATILVLGGTGKTGRLLIAEALMQNISVTALIRSGSTLEPALGLTIVEGSPLVYADVERAVQATKETPSAIVSTLGQTRESGNPWSAPTSPPRFMADAMTNVISAAKTFKIPKLVVMSMFGAGDSMRNLNFLMRPVMSWSNMLQTVEDHNLVDKLVKESGLDFVLLRPAMLKDGLATRPQYVGEEGEAAGFMPSISPRTVAQSLVHAVTSSEWDGKTPVICT